MSGLNYELTAPNSVIFRVSEEDEEVNSHLQEKETFDDCYLPASTYPVVILPNLRVPAYTVNSLSLPLSLAVWNGEVAMVESDAVSQATLSGEQKFKRISTHRSLSNTGRFHSTIDSLGNIITCYYGLHCIMRFEPANKHCQTAGMYGSGALQFKHPSSIAVHPITHKIFVVDSRNHRVQILNPDLTFCGSFGGKGSSYGEFNGPCDIAVMPVMECSSLQGICAQKAANSLCSCSEVDQLPLPTRLKTMITECIMFDNVYVTDCYNHRVQVFSSGGKYINSFGSERLVEPTAIATDNCGVVYVCEKGKYCISLFTTEGEYIRRVGGKGTIPLQFNKPAAIAVDANGAVFVYNCGNGSVSVFM